MSEDEMPTDKRTKSTPRFIKAETERMVVHDMASYFTKRNERADFDAFKRILTREGGVAPREGDEL